MSTNAKGFAAAACLIAFGLTGCMAAKRAELEKELQTKRSVCISNSLKTAIARATCLNEVDQSVRLPGEETFSDLYRIKYAARIAYAERVDKGLMTQSEAELEMAKISSSLVAQASSREDLAEVRRQAAINDLSNSLNVMSRSMQRPGNQSFNCRTTQLSPGYSTTTCN